MQIIPAILQSDVAKVAEQVALAATDSELTGVQLDIIDGQLAEQLTVTPYDLIEVDFGHLKADFHLMTQDPLDYVWEILAQKEHLPVRAIVGQVERMSDQAAFVKAVREQHWQAGLALDVETPLESIDEDVWEQLDQVLLLAVPMGRQGQSFDERVYGKLHELARMRADLRLDIEASVDGGVRPEQMAHLAAHGVGQVCVGSYVWQAADFGAAVDELREAVSD